MSKRLKTRKTRILLAFALIAAFRLVLPGTAVSSALVTRARPTIRPAFLLMSERTTQQQVGEFQNHAMCRPSEEEKEGLHPRTARWGKSDTIPKYRFLFRLKVFARQDSATDPLLPV